MKHLLACTIALMPLTATAEERDRTFGLDELAPLAENFRDLFEGFTQDMAPLMKQLAEKMSDLNAYEAPEVLPNGDIIIRRKPEPEKAPDDEPHANPDGSIDL